MEMEPVAAARQTASTGISTAAVLWKTRAHKLSQCTVGAGIGRFEVPIMGEPMAVAAGYERHAGGETHGRVDSA
jgi:hypothetical protein